jgi:Cytochrome c7 and related cytochrome c/Class III cytochrome C family
MSCPVSRYSALFRSPALSPCPIFVSDPSVYTRVRGRLLRPGAILTPVLLVLLFTTICAASQPIAYSHKKHIAIGLQCLDCHSMADIGPAATIPSVTKCMLCHAKMGTDKPEIKKVAAYAAQGREIPWVRVYGFDPQALVKFNHAPHIRANVQCKTCHGDMTQAETAQKLVNHDMGTCLTCHRQKGASQDCATCHY